MEIHYINNNKILCSVGNYYISYRGGWIFVQKGLKDKPQSFLPIPSQHRVFVKNRMIERFLRLEPRVAITLDEDTFLLSYQGAIYNISISKKKITEEHHFRDGMNNPLSFCKVNNTILYGEYFRNLNKDAVSVYSRGANGKWTKIYEFKKGEVIHIHQIAYDKYRNCFYILTGDNDSESAIWRADPTFKSVEPLFRGKQKYRSCFIHVEDIDLTYVTDTPLEKNKIYKINIRDGQYLEPEAIYEMPGPCIYGRETLSGECLFATSVEPDSSLPNYRYRITSKIGKGVQDNFVHIIKGNNKTGFKEVASFKKDNFPMWLFQFGNVQFADCNEIILTGQSIKKYDGKSILLKAPSME